MPNCFAVLDIYDIAESVFITPSITKVMMSLALYFKNIRLHHKFHLYYIRFIKNIINFSIFNNVLTKITSSNGFTCNQLQNTSWQFDPVTSDRSGFDKIVDHLNKSNTSYHTFLSCYKLYALTYDCHKKSTSYYFKCRNFCSCFYRRPHCQTNT